MLRLDGKFQSLAAQLFEGDPSQRRVIRGSINEVPTMQLKKYGRTHAVSFAFSFAPTFF